MSDVAVIVVNYATADLSIRAVESVLARHHGGRSVEVHVVDNASPGGDADILSAAVRDLGWGDQVTLWMEKENLGFGRGNNRVLETLLTRPEPPAFAFLLNPDAALDTEAVDLLARALEDDPEAGAAGASIIDETGAPQAAAFRFPTPLGEVQRVLNFGPLDRLRGRVTALPLDTPAGPVDWLTGAAVMFRTEALADVGIFDPDYFLYFEEVDLMRRLHGAGWKNLHVPAARVRHAIGASTGKPYAPGMRKRQKDYIYRSWRIYFAKTHGRGRALATAVAMLLAGALNIAHSRLRGRMPYLPLNFFNDHWSLVVRPLLTGREG